MAQRQKVGEQLKKMKEVIQEKEVEVNHMKQENINKYLKIMSAKTT